MESFPPGSRRAGGEGGGGEVGGREEMFLESWAGRDTVTQAFISPKHPAAPCDTAGSQEQ